MLDLLGMLTRQILRASPNYALISLEQTEAAMADGSPIGLLPDTYGVLLPQQKSSLPVRTVNCSTALLFFTLQKEGGLPHYLLNNLDVAQANKIVAMILDGVFEVKTDGGFISGNDAANYISKKVKTETQLPETKALLRQLSWNALLMAQEYDYHQVNETIDRLYCYNTAPAAKPLLQRFEDPNAVLEYLRLNDTNLQKALSRRWRFASENVSPWYLWEGRQESSSHPRSLNYKLYISPSFDSIPETLACLVETLENSNAIAFKIGSTLPGLLRPDKCVVYFSDRNAMDTAAAALDAALGDTAAQGVPFTCQLNSSGTISWGVDPEGSPIDLACSSTSWRMWVINHLAIALASGSGAPDSVQRATFACERIRQEGVNPDDWQPIESLMGADTEHWWNGVRPLSSDSPGGVPRQGIYS